VDVTLVGWQLVTAQLSRLAFPFGVHAVELVDPGNSSLKGIHRYLLETRPRAFRNADDHEHDHAASPHHTIVLLGDVVYSWACLMTLWEASYSYGYTGTSDMSESGGELWGIAWARSHEDKMLCDLQDGLLRHPPLEDTYQPGQLRRWVIGWHRGTMQHRIAGLRHGGVWHDVDDYTMDVDLPHHVPLLAKASYEAAKDDLAHGLTWGPQP
jgi:hypothetical protein